MSAELTEDDPKFVGHGLDAPREFPPDPQVYLWESNHPYAPFVGNALKWDSFVYDDGSQYEGLTRENTPHGKGVLTIGNGYGGAIQESHNGDRYEGEFQGGFVHGIGQYVSPTTGEMYRGEWNAGKRQGCGVLTDMNPFYKRVAAGMDPQQAWEASKDEIEANEKWGTWHGDYYVSEVDDTGKNCGYYEIKGVLQELDSVVTRARMFKNKPDGDVTIETVVDDEGKPLRLFQDPLHYPHDTKFMAPGPMGQCFPVPDNPALKDHMAKVARNWQRIWDMYNIPRETPPGSHMEKAEKLWNKLVVQLAKEKKRQDLQERRRMARLDAEVAEPSTQGLASQEDDTEDEGDDGGDLIASVPEDTGRSGPPRGSAFGSVSLGMQAPQARALVASVRRMGGSLGAQMQRRRALSRPVKRSQ